MDERKLEEVNSADDKTKKHPDEARKPSRQLNCVDYSALSVINRRTPERGGLSHLHQSKLRLPQIVGMQMLGTQMWVTTSARKEARST